jgi:hypothetical protein
VNWDKLLDDIGGRSIGIVIGLGIGWLLSVLYHRWKRRQERLSVLCGDARETVVLQQHIVERGTRPDGSPYPKSLRIRSLGQSPLRIVVPNNHLSGVLLGRAHRVTPRHTLIGMEGAEGSYLLETLTNFVCDRVANEPFDHDVYVMAPCCEPAELTVHQPIIVLLIRVSDLALFRRWEDAKEVRGEHGADGCRVLTLMELAKRYDAELGEMARRKAAGERTRHAETMYLLDLSLDQRAAPIPLKPIPWTRYAAVLGEMGLE